MPSGSAVVTLLLTALIGHTNLTRFYFIPLNDGIGPVYIMLVTFSEHSTKLQELRITATVNYALLNLNSLNHNKPIMLSLRTVFLCHDLHQISDLELHTYKSSNPLMPFNCRSRTAIPLSHFHYSSISAAGTLAKLSQINFEHAGQPRIYAVGLLAPARAQFSFAPSGS
ncbi:hypothetical protein M422DRAFT_240254 [Sphaerobolus stellatus SS14]|nr:hypothetical protein M422DRAFT_240254 [Sphaerobolus stellatus SS14]